MSVLVYLAKVGALFAAYFFTARFGLSINAVGGFATLIWLPSGISLAALLIYGSKLWPAITLAAFLANLMAGAPPLAALGIAIGNTLEPLAGTFLLNKLHFRPSLERLSDVLSLSVTAFLSSLISALFGVTALKLAGTISTPIFDTWLAWWIGDTISILMVASFLLVWISYPRLAIKPSRFLEATAVILILILIYLVIFRDSFGLSVENKSLAYMVFPPLIWVGLRFGLRGTVTANLLLVTLTIFSTIQGLGPFANSSPSSSLLFLQIFMVVASITTMILAAVMTERKRVEKTKDEFISMAAHELKTPITTIKGYAQLLEQYLKKTKNKKALLYTSKMDSQIDSLTRLIIDFFDVSKIQSGKLELEREEFEVDSLVKTVVEDMHQMIPNHKILIIGKTGKKLLADKYRISQVLMNLLSNAAKFSPKSDQIKIFLSAKNNWVTVRVQDFGIGISERDIASVFDRFFQARTNVRQSAAGMGLGLYISSEIIKRQRGKIWVKSQKGRGSTFSFSLPALR